MEDKQIKLFNRLKELETSILAIKLNISEIAYEIEKINENYEDYIDKEI